MEENLYLNLIYKQLSNAISPTELKQLEEWMAQSPENQQLAQDVGETWDKSEVLASVPEVDLDAEFNLLEARIQMDSGPSLVTEEEELEKEETVMAPAESATSGKNNRWFRIGGIAAGIAALVVLGFLILPRLTKTETIEWAEFSTGAEQKAITLADGSVVTLQENSRLEYPKDMQETERTVKLTGEGFFEVEPNSERPFVVEMGEQRVTVLGTSFLIRNRAEARENSVQVATGKVRFTAVEGNEILLVKGEGAVYNKEEQALREMETVSTNAYAWFSKRLEFKQTSMDELEEVLETYYQIELEMEGTGTDPLNCQFSGSFANPELEDMLDNIGVVLEAEVEKISPDHFKITGLECY